VDVAHDIRKNSKKYVCKCMYVRCKKCEDEERGGGGWASRQAGRQSRVE